MDEDYVVTTKKVALAAQGGVAHKIKGNYKTSDYLDDKAVINGCIRWLQENFDKSLEEATDMAMPLTPPTWPGLLEARAVEKDIHDLGVTHLCDHVGGHCGRSEEPDNPGEGWAGVGHRRQAEGRDSFGCALPGLAVCGQEGFDPGDGC